MREKDGKAAVGPPGASRYLQHRTQVHLRKHNLFFFFPSLLFFFFCDPSIYYLDPQLRSPCRYAPRLFVQYMAWDGALHKNNKHDRLSAAAAAARGIVNQSIVTIVFFLPPNTHLLAAAAAAAPANCTTMGPGPTDKKENGAARDCTPALPRCNGLDANNAPEDKKRVGANMEV